MNENENKTSSNEGLPLEDDKINVLEKRLQQEGKKVNLNLETFSTDSKNTEENLEPKQEIGQEMGPENNLEDEERKEKQAFYAIIKPVRTYERDIAETVRSTNASIASINVAEQRKKTEDKKTGGGVVQKTETFAFNGVFFMVSLVLIMGTIGVLGLLFFVYKSQTPVVSVTETQIISTDKTIRVDATGVNREQLLKLIKDNLKNDTQGLLTEIKFLENNKNAEQQISSEQFLLLLGKNAPSSLGRALNGSWLFGFYNTDHAEPFLLASISSFDNTFDGMLRWEKGMANDLQSTFLEYDITSGTTTEKINPQELKNSFEDAIIKSKNVRILKDIGGNTVLLYSFLSEKYFVITTNEKVFKEILNRFLASRILR